jgi:hypothetical protein
MNCGVLQEKKKLGQDCIATYNVHRNKIYMFQLETASSKRYTVGCTGNVIISRIFLLYRDRQQKITFHIPFKQRRLLAFIIKCAFLVDHTFHDRPTPRRSLQFQLSTKLEKIFFVSVKALTL